MCWVSRGLLDSLAFDGYGAAIVPATAVNYFLNSYWTFREDREQRSQ